MYGKYAHGQDYQNNPKSNEEIEKMIEGYKYWSYKLWYNKFSFMEHMQTEKTINWNLIAKYQKWLQATLFDPTTVHCPTATVHQQRFDTFISGIIRWFIYSFYYP